MKISVLLVVISFSIGPTTADLWLPFSHLGELLSTLVRGSRRTLPELPSTPPVLPTTTPPPLPPTTVTKPQRMAERKPKATTMKLPQWFLKYKETRSKGKTLWEITSLSKNKKIPTSPKTSKWRPGSWSSGESTTRLSQTTTPSPATVITTDAQMTSKLPIFGSTRRKMITFAPRNIAWMTRKMTKENTTTTPENNTDNTTTSKPKGDIAVVRLGFGNNRCTAGKKCELAQKSFETTDLLLNYAYRHSSPLSPLVARAYEKTKTVAGWRHRTIAPEIVQLSMNLMRLLKPNRSLVVGVFTGLGLIGVASMTDPNGRVVGIEDPKDVRKWERIGVPIAIEGQLMQRISIRSGFPVNTSLSLLSKSERHSYDFILLDDSKFENYMKNYEHCIGLLRPGGLLVISNALAGGDALSGGRVQSEDGRAATAVNDRIRDDDRVHATFLPYSTGVILVVKQ